MATKVEIEKLAKFLWERVGKRHTIYEYCAWTHINAPQGEYRAIARYILRRETKVAKARKGTRP